MSQRLTRLVPVFLAMFLVSASAAAEGETESEPAGSPEEGEESSQPTTPTVVKSVDEATAGAPQEKVEMSIYRELKTVETRVDDLKEKVFRSKARLLLLEEKVIRGVVSGAKAVVRHVNNLGPAYSLESVTYYFDGNPIYQKTNVGTKGELAREKRVEIFEANVPPGDHTLSITGVIEGKGTGLFEYLSDYSFEFSSSYSFLAQDGKTTRLDSILFKKGGALADYVEGPSIEFRLLDSRRNKAKQAKDKDEEAAAGAGD
jgi:hypothetical protein